MATNLTPPVVFVGDEIAGGLNVAAPEGISIFKNFLTCDGILTMLRGSADYKNLRSDPWFVISVGSWEGNDPDFDEDIEELRGFLAGFDARYMNKYPNIIWVLPINAPSSVAQIRKLLANPKYSQDQIIQMPLSIDTATETWVNTPVYYPFPWSQIFNSPPTVWYYKKELKVSVAKNKLTDDNIHPNRNGYNWIIGQLRQRTANWISKSPPPTTEECFCVE